MSASSVISLKNVTKRFGALTAVDNVSIDLKEGEFFALLGPSGCGKTTLLRMIAGFEDLDSGEILLDGADMTQIKASQRPVNLMFQSYALFPHMSVQANVAYGLEMENRPRGEIRDRVSEILERTELAALATRKPHQLSGGQRQRVALARALVKRPRVLLLDEPLGSLDKKLREQMQLELKRLQHDIGITFVMVTHDQEEALVMADRIALMKEGRIAQLADPLALYEKPASRFVASFIGLANLIEGKAVTGGIEVAGLGMLKAEGAPAHGTACTIAVRPERIQLSSGMVVDGSNSLSGTIGDVAYYGRDVGVMVVVPGLVQPVAVRLSIADMEGGSLRAGSEIQLSWRPEHGRILTD